MEAFALDALEFPAIAERVSAATETARGAELALALAPSADPVEVARRQALTAEAIGLLDAADEPSLLRIHDVRDAAVHAGRGGVLAPDALRRVADTCSGALRLRGGLPVDAAPLLAELAAAVDPGLAALADELGRRVEEDGSDLRDHASPKLRRLRSEPEPTSRESIGSAITCRRSS